MARNKKIKQNNSRKTPRKIRGYTPKVTKPRLINLNRSNKRKSKLGISQHLTLNKGKLREREKEGNSRDILCPPVPPPAPPKSPNSRKAKLSSAKLAPTDTIVIDSDDDCSVPEPPAMFYVDTSGGFNDKDVPKYINFEQSDDCVVLAENTLEDGELRDSDGENEVGTLNRTINAEEIPISDDDEEMVAPAAKRTDSIDNSVIFCSEVIDLDLEDDRTKVLEFIPIGYEYSEKRKKFSPDKQNRKNKAKKQKVSPGETVGEVTSLTKRMVIIDGNNVAFSHVCGKAFSVKGLDICINYFKKMGHRVKAVVPQFRLKRDKTTDHKQLEELYKAGDILLAPSKSLPGQFSSSYDDRLIISVAEKFDGVIISNDNFRDLLAEGDSWKKIIKTRVIGYTWADDAFFLPDDPYGRHGPKLKDLLETKACAAKD